MIRILNWLGVCYVSEIIELVLEYFIFVYSYYFRIHLPVIGTSIQYLYLQIICLSKIKTASSKHIYVQYLFNASYLYYTSKFKSSFTASYLTLFIYIKNLQQIEILGIGNYTVYHLIIINRIYLSTISFTF